MGSRRLTAVVPQTAMTTVNAAARAAIKAISKKLTRPRAKLLTIASTIRPRTSSMTAAARMTLLAGLWGGPRGGRAEGGGPAPGGAQGGPTEKGPHPGGPPKRRKAQPAHQRPRN